MNSIIITYHYLHGRGGGVYASRAFINAFAEISKEITLIYPIKDCYEPEGINSKVKQIPIHDKRSMIRKGFDFILGRSNRFDNIAHILKNNHFDVVVFDTSMVVHGLIDYFKDNNIRIITIHHNYQYEYFRDNAKGLLKYITLYWAKKFESEAIRKSDLNLTLTKEDKLSLMSHYGRGREIIEVIGAFEYDSRKHDIYPDVHDDRFIITGNLGSFQTEDSLLSWIKKYYPIFRTVFPNGNLVIAGKSPSNKMLRIAKECNISVIPSPTVITPFLAASKYYICPTSLGSGLKLRIMDGLSVGLPVVCHIASARGYDPLVEKGVILTYSDESSFRNQLEKLRALSFDKKSVIYLFEKYFSFASGVERLRSLLYNNGILFSE